MDGNKVLTYDVIYSGLKLVASGILHEMVWTFE